MNPEDNPFNLKHFLLSCLLPASLPSPMFVNLISQAVGSHFLHRQALLRNIFFSVNTEEKMSLGVVLSPENLLGKSLLRTGIITMSLSVTVFRKGPEKPETFWKRL